MAMPTYLPSPTINSFHIGPLVIHFYALMYLVGIAAAIIITRRRWRAVGGDPDLVGDIALWGVPAGIIGGRIYFDITTPMDIPHVWYGVFAVWDGGLGIWGGIFLAAAGQHLAAARARREPGPVHGRGGPGAAGGAGHRPDRELLQQGAFRPSDVAALGAGDPLPVPRVRRDPRRRPALRHLPADLPLRADLRLRLGGIPRLARSPPQDQAARPVRAVRLRLFRVPDLRGIAAHRLLGVHLRPAPQPVHRLRAGGDRRDLVLPQPAPARSCRGGRSRRGRRGTADVDAAPPGDAGSAEDAEPGSSPDDSSAEDGPREARNSEQAASEP